MTLKKIINQLKMYELMSLNILSALQIERLLITLCNNKKLKEKYA